jgi:hypothetical protein
MKLYEKVDIRILEKTAGVTIPSNPTQWPTEVTKSLKSQHPYISLTRTETKFDIIEPQEKRASGVVIVDKKLAIPFTIRPSDYTGKPSIDKLDVMFSQGKFAHLNKSSYERAVRESSYAQSAQRGDLPPSNRYIGGLTGDVSPLEHSHSSNMTGITSYASFGLISRVVRHANDLDYLENFLGTYHGINSIANSLGFSDSLEALKYDTVPPDDSSDYSVAQITKAGGSGFKMMFSNGVSKMVSPKDMRDILQEDYTPVLRQVIGRGYCIIRDVPALKSVDVPRIDITPSTVKNAGYYNLRTAEGGCLNAIVCTRQIGFCGKQNNIQVALGEDGSYTEGKAFRGVQINKISMRSPLFQGNVIEPGAVGCFLDESFANPMATPKLTVKHVLSRPNNPNIVIADTDMGEIGLVLLDGIIRPTTIHTNHNTMSGHENLPEKSYYMPTHMSFFTISERAKLDDAAAMNETLKDMDPRPVSKLTKNAMRWTLYGDTDNGYVAFKDMKDDSMRIKLAEFGADDYVIDKAMDMKEGAELTLYGLVSKDMAPPQEIEKTSSHVPKNVSPYVVRMLKKAAAEYTDGINQMAQDPTSQEEVENPAVLDSILSLQFVSDDTLSELIDAEPMLEDVEDKIAKALMASRHGEKSINEKTAAKTLKGIGEVRNSLKILKIELDARV